MKKRIIMLGVSILLLVAALIGRGRYGKSVENTSSDLWKGTSKLPFKTISVYVDPHEAISLEETKYAKETLERRVKEFSEEVHPLAVWGKMGDCFLSTGGHELYSEAVIASDDFFLMHRYTVLSGTLYPFGGEGVVLNRYAAWTLFGSDDAAGQKVKKNESETTVYAVVDDGLETPVVYLGYGAEDADASFFEAVIPELVKGFALESIHNCFYESERCIIVSNDTRFEKESLKTARKALFAETQPASFRVPKWEYREERAERVLMVWGGVTNLLTLLFLVFLVLFIVDFIRFDPFDLGEKIRRRKRQNKKVKV